jgi:hypothetical protein
MPEFKVQLCYLGKRKSKFFSDKESKEYHKFSVINADNLPNKYFFHLTKRDEWDNL